MQADKSHQEIIELLAGTGLFRDISNQALAKIASRFKKETHHKGAILYKKGDSGDKLYLISSGQIALMAPDAGGQDVVLSVLGQGEIFGEMALLTGEPRIVTVRMESSCELYALSKDDFGQILAQNPSLGIRLSHILSRRLARTTEMSLKEIQKRRIAEPRLVVLLRLIDEIKGTLLAVNLSVSLIEQSRRRVALIELGSGPNFTAAGFLKLPVKISNARDAASMTLLDLLKNAKTGHLSGLDVFFVPSAFFSSPKDKEKVISALNYLRSSYDFTVILASPLEWQSLGLVFEEADRVWLLSEPDDPRGAELRAKIEELVKESPVQTAISEVQIIMDGRNSFADQKKIKIGWPRAIDKDFEQNKKPFQALSGTKTLKAIERLARIIADLKIGVRQGLER
ncbi:MAG: cyclic nucleotide-binding domain-containing protein [Elusimicrobia bacterium]|nr:cyclic nucleotide-binding domain-containing protein [Elusimicrobiota bacterium]